jgi:hypothetical protein
MAHFAKIGKGNIVEQVLVVNDNEAATEQQGINFLKSLYGQDTEWRQTSYNTYGNVHKLGGTPFRKNYAGKGMFYDVERDAFRSKTCKYRSWTLNETTCLWEAPVAYPTDGQKYSWNEENQQWDLVE